MKKTSRLIITRADEVEALLQKQEIAAVLSIEHPTAVPGEKGAAPRLSSVPQVILSFWDSEQKVAKGPDAAQIEAGILFALEHLEKGDVIIHCHAGKSRSTAIALGVLALRHPELDENALLEKLLEIRPVAAPNIIVVEFADKFAGRDGKLLSALLAHPVIVKQREETEANRQSLLKSRPDIMRQIHPEKFPKP